MMQTPCTLLLAFLLLASAHLSNAQRVIPPSDTLFIEGRVTHPSFHLPQQMEGKGTVEVPQVIITNHRGEVKDTLHHLRGIPLRDFLSTVQFEVEKPRDLNTFILKLTASDGYLVTFSWNEVFNSACAADILLITEREGVPLSQLEERFILLCPSDTNTGRRYIMGLRTIEVVRVELE
jgi:hypothetical protein